MKLFLLSASLASDSLNSKLIASCQSYLQNKHELIIEKFSDFESPLYSIDIENKEGIPKNVERFASHLINADKIIFAVPEYNGSTPGAFKNMIDWVTRIRPVPFKNKQILIISASPSNYGGNRAFLHTRAPFESCGAFVYPRTFSLANAHNMIDKDGKIIDTKLEQNLHNLIEEFTS